MDSVHAEKPGFVGMNIDTQDKAAALKSLSDLFLANGFTKESYYQAVLAREEVFPTGLPTETVGVAIPHTDTIHVNRPGIAIGVLKDTIKFGMMGYPEEEVDVKILFMLAIKDPEMQIKLLQDLTELFSDAALMDTVATSRDPETIVALVQKFFK